MNAEKNDKKVHRGLPKMKVLNNSQLTKKTIGAAGGIGNIVGATEIKTYPTAYSTC